MSWLQFLSIEWSVNRCLLHENGLKAECRWQKGFTFHWILFAWMWTIQKCDKSPIEKYIYTHQTSPGTYSKHTLWLPLIKSHCCDFLRPISWQFFHQPVEFNLNQIWLNTRRPAYANHRNRRTTSRLSFNKQILNNLTISCLVWNSIELRYLRFIRFCFRCMWQNFGILHWIPFAQCSAN